MSNPNGTSVTMNSAAAAVRAMPGRTAYALRDVAASGPVRMSRLYRAFRSAERAGLIYSDSNPAMRGSVVWYPLLA